jgi:hypothetical protein
MNPTIADFGADVTFDENTVNAAPQVLDASVTLQLRGRELGRG